MKFTTFKSGQIADIYVLCDWVWYFCCILISFIHEVGVIEMNDMKY